MQTLRTSVRKLVEFLLRSGDIDSNNEWRDNTKAMQAGSNIHRLLQASGGKAYQAEVPLSCSIFFPVGSFNPHAARLKIREDSVKGQEGFFLHIEGRADGIIDDGIHPLVIDEIKGVSRDVSSIDEASPVHEAQARCYAYLYLRSARESSALSSAFGERVVIRLTYASMTTGEIRQIEHEYALPEIEAWFFSLLEKAQRWVAWRINHDELRKRSLSSLTFPLKPRDGQQELMEAVTSTIQKAERLYAQASTGSGKTIATLYPTLKAMGSGKVSRIAYLTAKTMARRSALECLDLLGQQGISTNLLVITARDKICPLREDTHGTELRARPLASLCNPVECPLARGHYDAVNDALFEAITTYDVLDNDRVRDLATRHHVCPYELQRDMARWSDIIICDYHYAFAPSASLLGLADESSSGSTVYLVDEAHNLIERMRDMYSAELTVSDLKGLEHLLHNTGTFGELIKAVRAVLSVFPTWDKTLPANSRPNSKGRLRPPTYQTVRMSDSFTDSLTALADSIDSALEQFSLSPSNAYVHASHTGSPNKGSVEVFLALRDMSQKAHVMLGALQRIENGYVTFLGRSRNGSKKLKIYCVDPSHDLDERLKRAQAAVFFSGTLLPMGYHRRLLAAQDSDASMYVQSSFDHRHQQILIGSDVSARFSQRGPRLYARIAAYLMALIRARPGNYLTFLPSYAMMDEVSEALSPLVDNQTVVVKQRRGMRENERERFVAMFRDVSDTNTNFVGLCVLGGIFGESIDLPGRALVGVIVVGTGMPNISSEREIIRSYFDAKGDRGFAYAYTYPGLSKVLQAAGRLIRTEKDRGVVLLLDSRFLEKDLRKVFPKEWKEVRTCTLETIANCLSTLRPIPR